MLYVVILLLLIIQIEYVYGSDEYYSVSSSNSYSWSYSIPQSCECVESGASLTDCDLFRCTCACDLTASKCDHNCCCDPDCSSDQTSRFSTLDACSLERFEPDYLQFCYSDNELSKINHRANFKESDAAEAALSDVLCLETKNQYYEGEFYDNSPTMSSTVFDTSAGQKDYEYTDTTTSEIVDAYYDQNDTINAFKLINATSTTKLYEVNSGAWTIPVADFSGKCNDKSYAKYENEIPGPFTAAYAIPSGGIYQNIASNDKSASCIREFSTDNTKQISQCQTAQSINSYIFDLYVATTADTVGSSTTATTTANLEAVPITLSGIEYIDPVTNIITDVSSLVTYSVDCPTKSFNDTLKYTNYKDSCKFHATALAVPFCMNVVKSVKYVVKESQDAYGTISAVYAYVTITDVAMSTTATSSFIQSFQLSFADSASGATTASSDGGNLALRTRSGNPGYIMGAPVLWAVTDSSTTIYKEVTEGLKLPSALALSPNSVMSTATTGGNCPTSSTTSGEMTVNFGYDISSGCMLSLTRDELKELCCTGNSNCGGSYTSTYSDSNGIPYFLSTTNYTAGIYVGIYGNADPLDTSQWLTISQPTTLTSRAWDEASSTCSGMYSGISYEILVSRTGERTFPQNKIIAARIEYISSDWVWREAIADASVQQNFPVSAVTTFIFKDDEELTGYTPPSPPIIFNVPHDVFYPFDIGNAGTRKTSSSTMLALIVTLTVTMILSMFSTR